MTSATNTPKNLHGKELHCTISRHLPNLQLQAVWHAIERLVNMAQCEKRNDGKNPNEMESPTLFAAKKTLADALNVSINTVGTRLGTLVKMGLLRPRFKLGQERRHRVNGRFATNDYDVMLHAQYIQWNPCPPYRYEIGGAVRSDREKVEATRADRFDAPRHNPATIRRIVELRESGENFQDIADVLGMHKGNVCRLYHRWKHQLPADKTIQHSLGVGHGAGV